MSGRSISQKNKKLSTLSIFHKKIIRYFFDIRLWIFGILKNNNNKNNKNILKIFKNMNAETKGMKRVIQKVLKKSEQIKKDVFSEYKKMISFININFKI